MFVGPDNSRLSIREHTVSRNTDQLYEPLRQTISNPNNIQRHSALTPIAAKSSAVSHDYRILSPQELRQMQQNIYIPNSALYPTNNLQKIKNQRFVVVDACERVLGPAISPEQLQRIKSQGFKKQQVLYDYKKTEGPYLTSNLIQSNTYQVNNVTQLTNRSEHLVTNREDKTLKLKGGAPLQPIQEQLVYEYQPLAERYTVQNYDNYGKRQDQFKYNLFSIIDEPINKCRQFGLEGCTSCPSNEIVASRNRPLSLNWQQ